MSEVLETEVFPPPDITQVITEDDTPVDNFSSEKQQRLLARVVCSYWGGPGNFRPFLAAAYVGIFSAVSQPPVVPDVFISLEAVRPKREHPVSETTLVRAKHSDYKFLVLTERLFARMRSPYIIGMLIPKLSLPAPFPWQDGRG